MIKLASRELCSGCGGCAAVCPARCIAMEEDVRGFSFPVLDADRCIQCGRCMETCPVGREAQAGGPVQVYAAAAHQDALLEKSSSGGVFGLLAGQVIQKGGLVVGAAFEPDFSVAHHTAETPAQLEALLCSKYVQSHAVDGMKAVLAAAREGRPVLFAGVGCQVNGVARALGQRRDKVLLADVVCHGVPSALAWRKYLAGLGSKYGDLKRFTFRDKAKGWQNYMLRADFAGGNIYQSSPADDPYMQLFLQNVCLRDSCHCCCAKENALSDLTLGDFWGVKNAVPGFAYQKGASVVLVRTQQGGRALEQLAPLLRLEPADLAAARQANPAIAHSAPPSPHRDAFFHEPDTCSLEELAHKYAKKPGFLDKLRRRLRK